MDIRDNIAKALEGIDFLTNQATTYERYKLSRAREILRSCMDNEALWRHEQIACGRARGLVDFLGVYSRHQVGLDVCRFDPDGYLVPKAVDTDALLEKLSEDTLEEANAIGCVLGVPQERKEPWDVVIHMRATASGRQRRPGSVAEYDSADADDEAEYSDPFSDEEEVEDDAVWADRGHKWCLSLHELSQHLELSMRRTQAHCNELESARMLELHQVNMVNTYCFVNYQAAIHAIRWRLSTIRDETGTPKSTDPEHYCARCDIVWPVLDLVDQDSPDGLLCPKCSQLTALLQKEDVSEGLFADLGFFELRLREVDQTMLPNSSFWAAYKTLPESERIQQETIRWQGHRRERLEKRRLNGDHYALSPLRHPDPHSSATLSDFSSKSQAQERSPSSLSQIMAQDKDRLLVRQSGRLEDLVNQLPHPETQTPSLVLTFACRPLRQQRGTGTVHLDLDPHSVASPNPVFLATSFLSRTNATRLPTHGSHRLTPPRRCCSIMSETSISLEPRLARANAHLQILFPYIDVICFPCSSRQCLALLMQQFACWRRSALWTQDRSRLAPELLVILTSHKMREEEVRRTLEGSLDSWLLRPSALTVTRSHAFGGRDKAGGEDRETVLKLTRKLLQKTRTRRSDLGLLFSAHHLMALVDTSLQRDQPFPGYVTLSRIARPVAPDLSQHLGNFIAILDQGQQGLGEFATDAIAASLLLDHYAPGMHAFPPRRVFHDLHRDACSEALRIGSKTPAQTKPETGNSTGTVGETVDSDTFLESIVARMGELRRSGEPAVALHAKSYHKYQGQWLSLRTRNTCLLCIQRVPQYELPCRHSICEHCVRVFGHASEEGPRFFAVPHCFLCGAYAGLHVRVRPPTAGVGVLCIDGGGVRGIIPTTILELLQEEIGLPIPVQEHFQLCAGVSAGALALSTLFLNGWTAAKCSRAFETFATTVFRRDRLTGPAGILQLWTIVNNALYNSLPLEVTLKAIFDATASMTSPSYASTIGAKLALVVVPIRTSDPLLITNYNGVGDMSERNGYEVYRGEEGLAVWEVNRSCTAAPAYFTPKHIDGVGLLQDAGVLQNNPINLALSELRSLYPAKPLPQYLVSLGTGIFMESASRERVPGKRPGFFKRHFLYRLFKAYMSLLSGKKTMDDFDRSTKTSPLFERCIRLDAAVSGPPAPLDDAGSVPRLKCSVHEDRLLQDAICALAKRIVASLFYFELDAIPSRRGTQFRGSGCISCLCRAPDEALPVLRQKLVQSSAVFRVNGSMVPGMLSGASFWTSCGNFRKKIKFTSGDATISITLQQGSPEYPISGSPFRLSELVEAQQLNAHFGRSDHRERGCWD
ncbi:hypothetical protein B0J13DRAFT_681344, partial [Dactylonectria estremocensis]